MHGSAIFFILGNHPAISVAEIFHKFFLKEEDVVAFSEEFLVVEREIKTTFINELGGTVKIGEVIGEFQGEKFPNETLLSILLDLQKPFVDEGRKFCFGFSVYGKRFNSSEIWYSAKELKQKLQRKGSVRFVRPQSGQVVSSVSAAKNGLLGVKGVELVLMYDSKKCFIGRTQSVQNFEMLSFRDYGRPGRDDFSGMLPPKLAQMMINLSRDRSRLLSTNENIIWDPFCGSGTILQEALLMGYTKVIGSDNSQKAAEDTKKNLEWLKREFVFKGEYEVKKMDVTSVGADLKPAPTNVDAIITEPYLGSPRARNIEQEIHNLEKLYHEFLERSVTTLKPDGRIVMIWPVFISRGKKYYLSEHIIPNALKKIPPLPNLLLRRFGKYLSSRGNLYYHRLGQGVGREIVILSLK